MKKRLKIALLLLACHASRAETIRVGVEENSPPKWIINSPKPVQGFCPDLLAQLTKADPSLSFVFPFGPQPQKRIEKDVEDKQLDLICALTRTPARELRFHYIDTPLYQMDYVLVARRDDPISPKSWDDVRALGNQGIILLNYDSSAIERLGALGGLNLDHAGKTAEMNLGKLQGQRGRFFYYPSVGVRMEIHKLGLDNQLRIISPAMESIPFFFLAGKTVTPETMNRLQTALQTLAKTGSLQQLRSKWLN